MKIFTRNRVVTVGVTLAALAVLMRSERAKEMILGEEKFLGVF